MTTVVRTEKVRKPTGADIDHDRLNEILDRMRSWHELSEDVKGPLPNMIVAAVSSGRPELARLAIGEGATPEMTALINLIASLLETNSALQSHAERLADQTRQMRQNLKGLFRLAHRIESFAEFRPCDEEESD